MLLCFVIYAIVLYSLGESIKSQNKVVATIPIIVSLELRRDLLLYRSLPILLLYQFTFLVWYGNFGGL
jgi:hypothetical protein